MTSFCGSVNDAEFLNDTSGSRRFWPVSVQGIDWGVRVDLGQLWAQAYDMWASDPAFDLTGEQDAERAAVALDSHTTISAEQETIEEYYRTEIMNMLFGKQNHSPRSVGQVGKILADLVGKHRKIGNKQRAWIFPFNEFATDRATWPATHQLKSV